MPSKSSIRLLEGTPAPMSVLCSLFSSFFDYLSFFLMLSDSSDESSSSLAAFFFSGFSFFADRTTGALAATDF